MADTSMSHIQEHAKEQPTFQEAESIVLSAISSGEALEAAAAAREQTVLAMHHYLSSSRLDLYISGLNVLHVTGTKGKGSTCCFIEAILQQHGMRTGMYTSPHLLKMNERIRVDGRPLDESAFAKYVCAVWDKLKATAAAAEGTGFPPMPTFFRLLTLVGMWAFVHER
jgi:folylpolyglutamate synthase